METKKFDGLTVKANSKKNVLDCSFCGIKDNSCLECPLKDGYYFVKSSDNIDDLSNSSMLDIDRSWLNDVIDDLTWLARHLRVSSDNHVVFSETIDLANTMLSNSISRLGFIKTFDK